MRFTKEQAEKLCNNGRAMEEYIKTEIIPHLTDRVEVEFGDMVTRGRYSEIRERDYCLIVRNDGIIVKQGGLRIMFDIKEYDRGSIGCIDIWDKADGFALDCLYNLSLNWTGGARIKFVLNNHIQNQRNKDAQVFDSFVI